MKLTVTLVTILALLQGCTSMGQLEADSKLPSDNESIFIIGVEPDNYRISAFPGKIQDGLFSQNIFLPATLYGAAKDGYVVGKASAGDALAITNVRVTSSSNALFLGQNFSPCGTAKTITFEIPKGKVIYLGSVSYEFQGDKLNVKYKNDLEAAKRHVNSKFPSLSGKLEYMEPQFLQTSKGCVSGPNYIPVYIKTR